jgi:transcriptional regulator with XRE-family HTH domain
MGKYEAAANEGQKMIFKFIKERMKEKKITQNQLAEIVEIGVTTMIRYFKLETPMPLGIYLEICEALELRPYLIPAENDNNEMMRMYFN